MASAPAPAPGLRRPPGAGRPQGFAASAAPATARRRAAPGGGRLRRDATRGLLLSAIVAAGLFPYLGIAAAAAAVGALRGDEDPPDAGAAAVVEEPALCREVAGMDVWAETVVPVGPHMLPPELLDFARGLVMRPELERCRWTPLAAFVVAEDIALAQVSRCDSCDVYQVDQAQEHYRLMQLAGTFFGGNLLDIFGLRKKDNYTQLGWAMYTCTNKMWVMSDRAESDFQRQVEPLGSLDAEGTAVSLCIRGVTHVVEESAVFSHFIWGHLFPVFVAVLRAGCLHRSTRLIFDSPPFFCSRSSWLAFYGLFFDHLPTFDRTCQGATHGLELEPTAPVLGQVSNEDHQALLSTRPVWERTLDICSERPAMHRVLRSRFREAHPEGHTVVYMSRGVVGAVGRRGESLWKRNLYNHEEFTQSLSQLVDDINAAQRVQQLTGLRSSQPVRFEHTTMDLPWHEQVRQLLFADVLIGLHGSAMGSHELWLPSGAVIVSVMSPHICECRWSYCAAASAERALLFVLATDAASNCDHAGRWIENFVRRRDMGAAAQGWSEEVEFEVPQFHSPHLFKDRMAFTHRDNLAGYSRYFDHGPLFQGLASTFLNYSAGYLSDKFAAWASGAGHRKACGGMALQLVDSSAPPPP